MKTTDYLHFIWLLAFAWVAFVVTDLPTMVKTTGLQPEEYQIVGTMRVSTDPYLIIPVYVAKKDMRSWIFMRQADQVMQESKRLIQFGGNTSAIS